MAADEQRLFRLAAQGVPGVARFVVVNFEREVFEFFFEPGARLQPGFRKGDALCAVFVSGELAKFLEFRDGPLWDSAMCS